MDILAGLIIAFAALLGVALTIFGLPGIWLAIAAAVLCELWRGGLLDLWTLVAAVALGLLAEVVELIASAAGARRGGATRTGAGGALIGALLGGLVGTFVILIPVIGTILGGVIGAAAGTIAAERGIKGRTWRESGRAGAGAAAGRAVAVVLKSGLAVVVAILLTAAAFIP